MVSGVGGSAQQAGWPSPPASQGNSVAALKGQVQQAQVQLDDWTSCVSAKTPKGQAEIQKLSGEISGDRERIARAIQTQSGNSSVAATTKTSGAQQAKHSTAPTAPAAATSPASAALTRRGSVDVWV